MRRASIGKVFGLLPVQIVEIRVRIVPLVLYVTCVVVSNKGVAVVYVINVCEERLISSASQDTNLLIVFVYASYTPVLSTIDAETPRPSPKESKPLQRSLFIFSPSVKMLWSVALA